MHALRAGAVCVQHDRLSGRRPFSCLVLSTQSELEDVRTGFELLSASPSRKVTSGVAKRASRAISMWDRAWLSIFAIEPSIRT